MRGYLPAVWHCRHFWLALVGMDLRARYRRSVLGTGWSLVQPVCMTVLFCTVFHQLFGEDPRRYGLYVLTGLAVWNFILSATVQSCMCFFHGESYIRQYPMPLAVYPLRTTLGGAIHLGLALAVVLVTAWLFNGFGNLAALPALLPGLLLLFVLGWSLALLLGFVTVFFNDAQHLAEVGAQLLFYATPIIYKADAVPGNRLAGALQLNPLAPFLKLIREPILDGRIPDLHTYSLAAVTALAAFAVASVTLIRLQDRLIFRM